MKLTCLTDSLSPVVIMRYSKVSISLADSQEFSDFPIAAILYKLTKSRRAWLIRCAG
jgi:hypothetical protein